MKVTDAIARFLGFERRSDPKWYATGDVSPTTVTVERATHLTPVFGAIRHLVDYISTLPADFYQIRGTRRNQVDPPELIMNVSDEYGGFENWLGQAVYAIVTRGNAVGEITAKTLGLPIMVRWTANWSGGEDGPFWLNGRALPDSLVAHIPWIVPDGKRLGLSPIEHFAAMVRAGLSAQEYADLKRGGGIPPTIMKSETQTLKPDEADDIKSRAVAAFASGRPLVLGKDWNLQIPSIPPNHAQFIETLKLSATGVATLYGIDPREIGGDAPAGSITYVNDESRALNRAGNAQPYVTRLEKAVSAMLPAGTVMKLNMNATVRADIKTRTEVIGAQIKDGRLSVDEARALEDRGKVPGGDRYNVPVPSTEPTTRTGDTP